LGEDLTIYQGQNLLVLQNVPPAVSTAGSTATIQPTNTSIATVTSIPTSVSTQIVITPTLENVDADVSKSSNSRLLVILLIIAAFVGAGMAVWLIREPNSN
jgi:uncharacterized protein HemX